MKPLDISIARKPLSAAATSSAATIRSARQLQTSLLLIVVLFAGFWAGPSIAQPVNPPQVYEGTVNQYTYCCSPGVLQPQQSPGAPSLQKQVTRDNGLGVIDGLLTITPSGTARATIQTGGGWLVQNDLSVKYSYVGSVSIHNPGINALEIRFKGIAANCSDVLVLKQTVKNGAVVPFSGTAVCQIKTALRSPVGQSNFGLEDSGYFDFIFSTTSLTSITTHFPTAIVDFLLQPVAAGSDSISLSNATPATGSHLAPQSSQQFAGTAQYSLNSADTGTVTLELADQANQVIARSPAVSVNKGTSSAPLTIQAFTLPDSGTLTLRAVLRPTGGAAIASDAATYSVSCSAAASDGAPAAAGCSANSITLDRTVPSNSDSLMALAGYLPPFCGFGTYTYSGPNKAHIFLELLDDKGNIVGRSTQVKTIDFPSGSNQSWGGGCTNKDPKQIIFITEQKMPLFDFPEGTPYDKVLGTLKLQASLYDSVTSAELATSTPVVYKIVPGVSAKSELLLSSPVGLPDLTIDPKVAIEVFRSDGRGSLVQSTASVFAEIREDYNELSLKVDLDLAASKGKLDAEIIISDIQGAQLSGAQKIESQSVVSGHNQIYLDVQADLKSQAATVDIYPRLTLDSGQILLLSPPITLKLDNISILSLSPDPKNCGFTPPQSLQDCLVYDEANSIQTALSITPATSGQQYARFVQSAATNTLLELTPPPSPGKANVYNDIVHTPLLKSDVSSVSLAYYRQSHKTLLITNLKGFTTRAKQIAAGIANQAFDLADGKLFGLLSTGARKFTSLKKNVELAVPVLTSGVKLPLGAPVELAERSNNQPPEAASNPAFIPIQTTWQFDPPIPHDGSFSATISLNYSAAQLPDDPNFVESKLQVVSIDSAGALHISPTTLDMTNKVATAQIDGLDPSYSLAVIGPFSQVPVMFASAPTAYALVNTGSQDTNLNITAYRTDGTGTPATSVLKARNRMQSTKADWVQAWSNPSTIAGVSWFDNGSQFAVNPAQTPGQVFVFTDVEYDIRKSTEIDLANTSLFSAITTIELFGADGSSKGRETTTLAPKSTYSSRIESLFPGLETGFTGYAIVSSRQTITASGYQWTNTTATGLAAQPLTASQSATNWYAPQLAGADVVTTLHLVNTASTTANVTLKAWSANGSAASGNGRIQLPAGQQYTKVISDIFGIDPGTLGSIEADSDTAGLFGDVLTVDSNFIPKYAVSLPLSAQPATSSVLPYASADTTVYVFNPNSSAANVTVTPYGNNGAAGAASSASVPAFGRAGIKVSSTGYATIGSTQPLVAAGWMVVPSGTTTGYLALASNAAPNNAGGAGPQVSSGGVVNAASFSGKLARGGLGSIFGTNFVAGAASAAASSLPLPLSLAGVSVTVGGIPAPLIYVNANQINFQVPFEVPAGSSAAVVVTVNGVQAPTVFMQIADYSVGIFTYARTSSATDPVIVHGVGNALVTPSNPAAPNEILVVYATGVGKLSNPPRTGAGAPSSPPATAVDNPTITLGGTPLQVSFAGLTPGFSGLVQFNIQMPASLPTSNLPLVIQFPGDSSLPVNLAVQGNTAGGPKLTLSTKSLAFGNVSAGQTKDLSVIVSNTGSSALSVNSATVAGTGFSLTTASTFTVQAGASQTMTVRFSPAAAAAVTGTLTIRSNDAASPAVVSLTGAGADFVLGVDGGQFDYVVGYPNGTATAYFVNRLTPPSYPATIRSVQIYFSTRDDGLKLNTPITVVSATNPSGSATLSIGSAGAIDLTPSKIGALDQFITVSVPARTITSGDFVVGFMVQNPANVYPADLDQATPSQKRSYTSSNGLQFSLLDSFSASVAGNLGIRAIVTLGGTSNTP